MTRPPTTPWRPADCFGNRLQMVRKELGLTIEQASEQTGFNHASWSTWERGRLPRNLPAIVQKISDVFGVDREWLMWGTDAPPALTGDRRADDEARERFEAETRARVEAQLRDEIRQTLPQHC